MASKFLSDQEVQQRVREYLIREVYPPLPGFEKQVYAVPRFYYSKLSFDTVPSRQIAMADENPPPSLQPCSLSRIFAEEGKIALITGKPGVGKTAVLRLIAACCVNPELRRKLVGEDESLLIPVFLHAQDVPREETLGCVVVQRLIQMLGCSREEAISWFRERIENLVVIIDGLDEAGYPNRESVAKMAQGLSYRPKSRVIVAGRPEIVSLFGLKGVYILAPMSESTQINYIVDRLFAAGLTNIHQVEDKVANILEQLSAAREMLGNHMFLDIVIDATILGEALRPEDLCWTWVKRNWGHAVYRRGIDRESQEKLMRAASVLAWHLQEGGVGLEDELASVLEQDGQRGTWSLITDLCHAGLLIQVDEDYLSRQRRYAFAYQTIQSLLVARRLYLKEVEKDVFAFLKDRMTLPEWEQALAFYLMYTRWAQSQFLSQIIKTKLPGEEIRHRKLSLLSNLIKLTGGIFEDKDYWRAFFLSVLRRHRDLPRNVIETAIRVGGDEAVSYLVNQLRQSQGNREEIVLALGQSRSKSAIPVLIDILRDDADDACYAAVVALSNMRRAATEAIIQIPVETLSTDARHRVIQVIEGAGVYNKEVHNYLLSALALSDSTPLAVCDVARKFEDYLLLLTALRQKHTSDAAVVALKQMPPPPATILQNFAELVNDYPELRGAFAEVVSAWRKANAFVPMLLEFLKDDSPAVRKAAIIALGKIRSQEIVELLIKLLADEDPTVARAAAQSLGETDFDEAVLPLIKTAESATDSQLRADAILALAKKKDPRAVRVLTSALELPDNNVRLAAIEALGELRDVQTIPALLSVSAHEELCYAVATALTKMSEEDVIPQLQTLLGEQNSNKRKTAIAVLSMMQSDEAEPYIIKTLNSDEKMREVCIQALKRISSDRSIQALREFVQAHPKTIEAIIAVWALKEIGKHSREAVRALIDIVWSVSGRVRIDAIAALGELKNREVIDVLIKAASNRSEMVRREAVYALRGFPSMTTIPVLVEKLRDPSPIVRDEAIRSLAKILPTLVYVHPGHIFGYYAGERFVTINIKDRSALNNVLRAARALKHASRKQRNNEALRIAVETEIRVKIAARASQPTSRSIV